MRRDLAQDLVGQDLDLVRTATSSTIAAAVSSQVVSMPRTRMVVRLGLAERAEKTECGRHRPGGFPPGIPPYSARGAEGQGSRNRRPERVRDKTADRDRETGGKTQPHDRNSQSRAHGAAPAASSSARAAARSRSPRPMNSPADRRQAHGWPVDELPLDIIRPPAIPSRTGPCPRPAARACSPRRSTPPSSASRIDFAIHSAKDLPTALPEGLVIAGYLPREDVRDALIARDATSVADLRQGAVVGSASLRRQAMLRRARPDLDIVLLRGSVGTRLDKVARGEIDATLLAYAGLKRLGLADRISGVLLDRGQSCPPSARAPSRSSSAAGRCAAAEARRADPVPRHRHRAGGRARLPDRTRRILPHADRRPCDRLGRSLSPARPAARARRHGQRRR